MIQILNKSVVFGSSDGIVARYSIDGSAAVPSDLDFLMT
jgi:hypothetical protein